MAKSTPRIEIVRRARPGGTAALADQLTIATWNLGYAGLGADSDFVVDGGSHWFPPSRQAAQRNRAGITEWLKAQTPDVLLLQEVAKPGMPNYWTDLKGSVERALADRDRAYEADLESGLKLFPMGVEHGKAIYYRGAFDGVTAWSLPKDGDISSGWLRKQYSGLVARIPAGPGARAWVVVNIHLAAFDPGALLRRRQLEALVAMARREYEAGAYVVIGGDWNMRLAPTDFPHTTTDKNLEWLADFDRMLLPEGWRIVADVTHPTVRTNDQPFVPGENYTAVIDGFVTSPNVRARSVQSFDLGFAHSDHQPVQAVFEREPESNGG